MGLSQPSNQGCDVGVVADITLTDGSQCSGVLIGLSSSASILDRWVDTRSSSGRGIPSLSIWRGRRGGRHSVVFRQDIAHGWTRQVDDRSWRV